MNMLIVLALVIVCLVSLVMFYRAYCNSSESLFAKTAFLVLTAADILTFIWMYGWVTHNLAV